MKKITAILLSVTAAGVIVFAPGSATAQQAEERFVSPEWLAANIKRSDIRIVDMRGDVREYWESHIPGAVFLNVESLRWPNRGVPGMAMETQALALLLGRMGITRETVVVIHSEVNHYRAAYFAWTLDYLDHPSWHILLGGFDNWRETGRPLTQDYPRIAPATYRLPAKLNTDVLATLDEVRRRNPSETVLLDVRPADLFSGEKGTWKRKGHIQGALNHFWALDLKPDGSWRNQEDLKATYAILGAVPDKGVIVSCGQGLMSAHSYITLKYVLNFPRVKNYDGGFTEWVGDDSLPVGKGLKPRQP